MIIILNLNSIEHLRFTNCYGKANRNEYLGTVKHDWTSIAC